MTFTATLGASSDLLGGVGSMEVLSGTTWLHDDPLTNLNAFTLAQGSASSLSSNIITQPQNSSLSFGHPDWNDGTVYARVQWNTGGLPWIFLHMNGNGRTIGGSWNAVKMDFSSTAIGLEKIVGGTQTGVSSAAVTPTNGTWYWMALNGNGTTYTATLYADNAGAAGTQIATCSGTISDTGCQVGIAAIGNSNSSGSTSWGGAFNTHVLSFNGPMPNGWQVVQGSGDILSFCWSGQQAHSGSRSLSIYAPTTAAYGYFQTSLSSGSGAYFNCFAGQSQTWTMWVKGLSNTSASADMYFTDGLDNFNYNYAFTTSWVQQTFTYTPTATTSGGRITLIPGQYPSNLVGTWYWDDVLVIAAGMAQPGNFVPGYSASHGFWSGTITETLTAASDTWTYIPPNATHRRLIVETVPATGIGITLFSPTYEMPNTAAPFYGHLYDNNGNFKKTITFLNRPVIKQSINSGFAPITLEMSANDVSSNAPAAGDLIQLFEQNPVATTAPVFYGIIEDVPDVIDAKATHQLSAVGFNVELGETLFTKNYVTATDIGQIVQDILALPKHVTFTSTSVPNPIGITAIYNFQYVSAQDALSVCCKMAGPSYYFYVDENAICWFVNSNTSSVDFTVGQGNDFSTRTLNSPITNLKNKVVLLGATSTDTSNTLFTNCNASQTTIQMTHNSANFLQWFSNFIWIKGTFNFTMDSETMYCATATHNTGDAFDTWTVTRGVNSTAASHTAGAVATITTQKTATYDQSANSQYGVKAVVPPLNFPTCNDQTTLQNIVNTLGAQLNRRTHRVMLTLDKFPTRITLGAAGGTIIQYFEPNALPFASSYTGSGNLLGPYVAIDVEMDGLQQTVTLSDMASTADDLLYEFQQVLNRTTTLVTSTPH